MTPRQARRERREAERKAKKLELKKGRMAEDLPSAIQDCSTEIAQPQRSALPSYVLNDKEDFPEIQPRWNPELEDEFPKEIQIRNNAIADRISLKAGLPIPPPGPTPTLKSIEDVRQYLLAKRAKANGFVSQTPEIPTSRPPKTRETGPPPAPDGIGFVSQNAPSRAEINRANAQHSTGPRSENGKLASSRNSTKHGLASGQVLIPGEDPAAFESLLNDLLAEHQPQTPTERTLTEDIAQSHWLSQRAIRLQNTCFTENGVNEKQLALFLRYQTTHQRAFYKALNTLMQLKKDAARAQRGFVSQARPTTPAQIGSVSQNDPNSPESREFVPQNPSQLRHESGNYPKSQAA